jgi:sugar phosphate isomerase/epimerase
MLDRNRITINQITTNNLTLPQAAAAYGAAGIKGIAPWRDKVEAVGIAAARQAIADNGLEVTGFCLAGLFTRDGKGAAAARIDDARRAIDIAAEIGSPSIVTVVGGLLPDSKSLAEARSFAFDCLAETLEHARGAGVVMALEPLHPMYTCDWSVVGRLSDVNAWCDRLGDGIGVAVDSYHVWWDSELWQGIEEAGRHNRLAAFHVSDWKMQTESLLMDRGIPGEGVIDLKAIGEAMVNAGFGGWTEVEIFSERHWARPADQLIEDIVAGCLRTM